MNSRARNARHDGFIIFLIVMVILGALELGARAVWNKSQKESAARAAATQVRSWDEVSIPFEDRPESESYKGLIWAEDFVQESQKYPGNGFVYKPFSLWVHKPYKNKYITFMENGYRVTVPSGNPDCKNTKKVFFFGGSAIAGDGIIRDEDTIPSIFSRLARDNKLCVEVMNYSQSGFNQGNEYVLFLERLAEGDIPDLVIFYDGANDATHRIAYGVPHMAFEFFSNIMNFRTDRPRLRQMLVEFLRAKSVLLRYILPPPMEEAPVQQLETDMAVIRERAEAVAESYRGKFDVISKISRAYGFKTFLVLQPTIFQKTIKSADEKKIVLANTELTPTIQPAIESFYANVKRLFKEKDPCRCFIDLSDIFLNKPNAYFVDYIHVSPYGNEFIADRIYREMKARQAI